MPSLSGDLTIRELIESGFIKVPTEIHGLHSGNAVTARLERDGTVTFRDIQFNSLSVAAGRAATLVSKVRTPGREYLSLNGWKFWKVRDANGAEKFLSEIRAEAKAG